MLSNIRYRLACWLWPDLKMCHLDMQLLRSRIGILSIERDALSISIRERDKQIEQLNKPAYVVCQLESYLHVCRLDLHDIRKLINNIENKIEVLERLRKDSDEQVTLDADTEPGRVDRAEEQ